MATIEERVRALIQRLAPAPICGPCVVERLGLSISDHIDIISHKLAGTEGFELRIDTCAICGTAGRVIHCKPR